MPGVIELKQATAGSTAGAKGSGKSAGADVASDSAETDPAGEDACAASDTATELFWCGSAPGPRQRRLAAAGCPLLPVQHACVEPQPLSSR